jgi:putative transposase
MDENRTLEAIRYVELNPVKANMVKYPWDYKWSSAKNRVLNQKDLLLQKIYDWSISDWKSFLLNGIKDFHQIEKIFSQHEKTGRPFGNENFIQKLELITGRVIQKHQGRRDIV